MYRAFHPQPDRWIFRASLGINLEIITREGHIHTLGATTVAALTDIDLLARTGNATELAGAMRAEVARRPTKVAMPDWELKSCWEVVAAMAISAPYTRDTPGFSTPMQSKSLQCDATQAERGWRERGRASREEGDCLMNVVPREIAEQVAKPRKDEVRRARAEAARHGDGQVSSGAEWMGLDGMGWDGNHGM